MLDMDDFIVEEASSTQPAVELADGNRSLICAAVYSDPTSYVVERAPKPSTGTLRQWRDEARKHCHHNGVTLRDAEKDEPILEYSRRGIGWHSCRNAWGHDED